MDSKNFDRMTRGLAGTTSRRQALKMLGGGLLGGAIAGAGLTGRAGVSAQTVDGITLPAIQYPLVGGGTAPGTLPPTNFFIDRGQLAVAGNVLDAAGNVVGTFESLVTPQDNATCEILRLELGPVFLNVLGLEVELPEGLLLVITANPEGGLVGELLCAVANLLSGNGRALGRLRNLLNQILGALGLA